MRYVFYAFLALGVTIAWMNLTEDGMRAKRHLLNPHVPAPVQ